MDIEHNSSVLFTRPSAKKTDIKGRKTRTGSARKSGQALFSRTLDKQINQPERPSDLEFSHTESLSSDALEHLLDDVHVLGEQLSQDPVFGPLKRYRQAVGKFLTYVIDMGLETAESAGIRNPVTLQQKKYTAIRVIDARLEELATHVLKGQSRQLSILERIDEIYGMLVDLTR